MKLHNEGPRTFARIEDKDGQLIAYVGGYSPAQMKRNVERLIGPTKEQLTEAIASRILNTLTSRCLDTRDDQDAVAENLGEHLAQLFWNG